MLASGSPGEAKKLTIKELEDACRRLNYSARDPTNGKQRRPRAKTDNTSFATDQSSKNQLAALDNGVKLCARKYNEFKSKADALESELQKKLDTLAELVKESDVLGDMVAGNNPDAKKIAKLTKGIEEANQESERKLHYRLQLNHMYKRLLKNSIAIDAHMNAMSSTVSAVERERQRCVKMLGDVESALVMATRELEATIRETDAERLERHRIIEVKRIEASNAEKLEEWRVETEASRNNFELSMGSNFKKEKEKRLNYAKKRRSKLNRLNEETEEKHSALESLERSFTRIKVVTGVNSLEDMLKKFTNHQEVLDQLLQEKQEAEERLSTTKILLGQSREKYDEIQANGYGETELNRQIFDDMNTSIAKERVETKVIKSTNKRLEGILVGLRHGGMGLYQRLLPFHSTFLDGDATDLSESVTESTIQAAHNTLEMLKVTEKILGKMLDVIGGVERIADQRKPKNRQADQSKGRLENSGLREDNCRIKLKVASPSGGDDELDEKSAAYRADMIGDDESVSEIIPTRISMKARSDQQVEEARRFAAQRERIQKIKEADMSTEDTGEEINKLISVKARQAQAAMRMAKHNVLKGMPESVSIRDDPITKAKAFLTELPYTT